MQATVRGDRTCDTGSSEAGVHGVLGEMSLTVPHPVSSQPMLPAPALLRTMGSHWTGTLRPAAVRPGGGARASRAVTDGETTTSTAALAGAVLNAVEGVSVPGVVGGVKMS